MDFLEIRKPNPNEVRPGFSGVMIGIDLDGAKWVIRKGDDELGAFGLSEVFFGHVVPYTERIPEGTAQKWITGKTAYEFGEDLLPHVRSNLSLLTDMANMICLDYVIGNADRHTNNWMISSDDHIYAIDNQPGSEPISLRSALRPVFRCLLRDDPDLTPFLIDKVKRALYSFDPIGSLVRPDFLPRKDILEWEQDLKGRR